MWGRVEGKNTKVFARLLCEQLAHVWSSSWQDSFLTSMSRLGTSAEKLSQLRDSGPELGRLLRSPTSVNCGRREGLPVLSEWTRYFDLQALHRRPSPPPFQEVRRHEQHLQFRTQMMFWLLTDPFVPCLASKARSTQAEREAVAS